MIAREGAEAVRGAIIESPVPGRTRAALRTGGEAIAKRASNEVGRSAPPTVIGWREWVALGELGIPAIKAKVDTGARSSALHAYDVRVERRGGAEVVRFRVHPYQRDATQSVEAEAELADRRTVRTSGGHETLRPVIETAIELMGRRWPIELTLINRDAMGFRMLLGRQAIRGRFVVEPGRSYLGGKRPAPVRKKKKKKRTRPDAPGGR